MFFASLFSWYTSIMQMLIHLMLSWRSLKSLSSLFFFLFSVQLGWFALLWLPVCRSIPRYHLICWFQSSVFFFQLYSSTLSLFYIFSNSLLNFSLCSSILLSSLSIFMIFTLNSLLGRLFISTSFSSSSGILSFSLFGTYSSVSSFLPNLLF